MTRYLLAILCVFTSVNANASEKLPTKTPSKKIPMNFSSEFIEKLATCEEFSETLNRNSNIIVGFTEKDNCQVTQSSTNGNIVCNFAKSDLSEISKYYTTLNSKDSKKSKSNTFSLDGNYNIDFKMAMPEIDISNLDSDDFSFNFKMQMPEIKIEKVKNKTEILIEGSCK